MLVMKKDYEMVMVGGFHGYRRADGDGNRS